MTITILTERNVGSCKAHSFIKSLAVEQNGGVLGTIFQIMSEHRKVVAKSNIIQRKYLA